MLNDLLFDWIAVDVSRKDSRIGICLHEDGLVTSLKEVTVPIMLLVQVDRISRIQEMHDPRKVRFRRFETEVIMAVHQTIEMNDAAHPLVGISKNLQKIVTVVI